MTVQFNFSSLMRQFRHITGQSRKVTYRRPPIYNTDTSAYPTSGVAAQEIVVPDVQAFIQPLVSKDYNESNAGPLILGSARIYIPPISILKQNARFNFDQFNEVEEDEIIDVDRNVYEVPTNSTSNWSIAAGSGTISTDTEEITISPTSADAMTVRYTPASAENILECDRVQIEIYASGALSFRSFAIWAGGLADAYKLNYDVADFVVPAGSSFVIDVPYKAEDTSIYASGIRYAVTTTSGASWNDENDCNRIDMLFTPTSGSVFEIRDLKFYKSVVWNVERTLEYRDEFIVLSARRLRSRSDSKRRARA